MAEFTDMLEILKIKGLAEIQILLALLVCIVIVLYLIDSYRYEKNETLEFLLGENIKIDIGKNAKNTLTSGYEEILAELQNSRERELFIPKVPLTGKTAAITCESEGTTSLFVYNTATSEDMVPGYYYWHNGQWVCFSVGSNLQEDQMDWPYNLIPVSEIPGKVIDKMLEFINNHEKAATLRKNNHQAFAYTPEKNTLQTHHAKSPEHETAPG